MPVLYRIGAPLGITLGRCPIAVAGTRGPTPWGARAAREVGRRLAERSHTVVTGFARGVDEEATFGALEVGGRVVAVLPHLLERNGRLSPRAAWLLRIAARRNALASLVAEKLVRDDRYVGTWLAARNRIVVNMAAALVVPEARFKLRWGTRHAVEHALAVGRPVVVLKPQAKDSDVVKAFEYFRQRGAAVAANVGEALGIINRCCSSRPAWQHMPPCRFKNLWIE